MGESPEQEAYIGLSVAVKSVLKAEAFRFEAEAPAAAETRTHKELGAGTGSRLRALFQAKRARGGILYRMLAKIKADLAAKFRLQWAVAILRGLGGRGLKSKVRSY